MYRNFADVARACAQRGIGPAQLFLESECRLTERAPDEVRAQLRERWAVMEASARQALEAPQRTAGGLIDGMAHRQWTYAPGQSLCGPFLNRVMARALSCSEVNASMGRICAAPTAGACGVLPAVLVSLQEERGLGWEALEGALLVASGFGAVVMRNATVAGAEGGCQAECGVAAAMAAAAAVQAAGGTLEQMLSAFSHALSCCMGLICDPVAGLVQVPAPSATPPRRSAPCSARTWRWPGRSSPSRRTRWSRPCAASAASSRRSCGRPRRAASRTRKPGAPSPRAWPRNNARQNAPGVLSWG